MFDDSDDEIPLCDDIPLCAPAKEPPAKRRKKSTVDAVAACSSRASACVARSTAVPRSARASAARSLALSASSSRALSLSLHSPALPQKVPADVSQRVRCDRALVYQPRLQQP